MLTSNPVILKNPQKSFLKLSAVYLSVAYTRDALAAP
jgi:hypothetical protein